MKNWITQLLPIRNEYMEGNPEPMDGDDVEDLIKIIRAKLNLNEGNITPEEYENILDAPRGTTPMSMDDLNDISLGMVEDLVSEKLIPDCQDTDDETEFQVQDVINKRLAKFFGLDYDKLQE